MAKNSDFKYDIPEKCYVSMMKKVLVEKFDETKYFLASHPYPKIEGEMVIFKPKKADQTQGTDVIVYRDYSLRKRLETTPKIASSEAGLKKKKSKEKGDDKSEAAPEPQPNLMCLEVDICEPLSRVEWDHYITVINETKGLGWF